MFERELTECFLVTLIGSGLPLGAAAVTGVVVSVVQAVTQIQEQSIGYIARLGAAVGVLALTGEWISRELVMLLQTMMSRIANLGGM